MKTKQIKWYYYSVGTAGFNIFLKKIIVYLMILRWLNTFVGVL